MAEWRGFEPPRPYDPNDLANRPLQPLEYHSVQNFQGVFKRLRKYIKPRSNCQQFFYAVAALKFSQLVL